MTPPSSGREAFRVVGIGEILWDVFPEKRVLGGAPANFAFHARSLGAAAAVVSRVGTDELGDQIVAEVGTHGVETRFLERDPVHPTGTVSVRVDTKGKPVYEIHEDVAWDFIAAGDEALGYVSEADAICFGSLAQRSSTSQRTIQRLLAGVPETALKVFDVNLRQSFYSPETIESSLVLANVLKLSDDELPAIAGMMDVSGSDEACLEELARRFSLRLAALTRGSKGSLLWSEKEISTHPGVAPPEMRDTVGAGDSFTATAVMGLLAGHPLDRVNDQANRVASWVCSQDGAAPALPEEYAGWFSG